jgi:uncharacterized surface protein with fasciclin (FAS1) repeats
MKYQERALRITVALALTGLIASQIPMRGQTALGSVRPPGSVLPADGYLDGDSDNSGSFLGLKGFTNRNAITGLALGLLGFGAYSTALDSRAVASTSAGAVAGSTKSLKDIVSTGAGDKSIYDVLKSMSQDYSETAKLVDDAELMNTLRDAGPFTLFAPTNEALLMEPDVLTNLHKPENKAALISLLKRHVVAGRYKINDLFALKDGTALETLAGTRIIISHKNNTELRVNNILVGQNDIAATNGWIHPLGAAIPE